MAVFRSELKKALKKNLPQGTGYELSRRIEGAIVPSEDEGYYEFVTIIVDGDLNAAAYAAIVRELHHFIKSDNSYRRSKYKVILWKNGTFTSMSRFNLNTSNARRRLDEICVEDTPNEAWGDFWQMYQPHKKAGKVILIVNAEKIETLAPITEIGRIKNMLIVFPVKPETEVKRIVSGIPCIAYVEERTSD